MFRAFASCLFLLSLAGCVEPEDSGVEENAPERDTIDCLTLDRLDGLLVPPAGVAVGFRVRDCDGAAVRKLQPSDIVVINDEKGEPFNASSEGGAVSEPGVITDVELYSVLTLDFSESIFAAGAAEDVVDGAIAYIDATLVKPDYPVDHKIAIIAFGAPDRVELIVDFTDDPNELQRALSRAIDDGSRGTTDLYDAYIDALTLVGEQGSPDAIVEKIVVVMTDGTHEAGNDSVLRPAALEARAASDATIYAIGIEGDYDSEALSELASAPGNFIPVSAAADLGAAFEDASQRALALAQSNYVVGVCTPIALGAPSLTLQVTLDGTTAADSISYDATQLNGHIEECDANKVARALSGG